MRGGDLPYAAKCAGTLSADHEHPPAVEANGTAGVRWRYTGHHPSAFDVDFGQHRVGGYSQVDAHIGLTYHRFRLDAFVLNLTDTRGVLDVATVATRPGRHRFAAAESALSALFPVWPSLDVKLFTPSLEF